MPTWLDWLNADRVGVVVAIATAIAAAFYAHRQTGIAREAKVEAKRSADAAEDQVQIAKDAKEEAKRSAEAASEAVRIEARRDHHDYGASRVELVSVKPHKGARDLNRPSYVATVKNAAPMEFRYRARIYYTADSYSDIGFGTLRAGESTELHLGRPDQAYHLIKIWFDGECSCGRPEDADGHWLREFGVPAPPPRPIVAFL
ncbi:hypothetical protein MED01_003597 [Micromonospora sp. MED01]|uniref:hypothetical protein n=1 Tax=Micromonospora alfalfae TaxID=2911212 RepID=UPI001EE96568|nr:hypothetical protein [Micromonospora alfalfae]MCG5465319.1 hypothetical protein [Micromonospora alfalfae]